MGQATALRPGGSPRRALFTDARGAGLRVTWHAEHDLVVLSLWREDRCIGTFRMPFAEVGRLTAFLADHLAREQSRAADATADSAQSATS